jgi:calcineurin-like phosphoesterase family protein
VIFFTADLHLGHANIIKHCDRPFSSVEEMDEHLISAGNSHVRPNDSVYIIGDLIFRNTASPENYISRLRGKKHLILGNHDKDWVKKADMTKHFASVERFAEISDGQHKITLCHYPLMSWNHIAKGSYMIHGHIHNNRDAMYFPLIREMPNLLNAGVEINGYRPVRFDELVKNNEGFKSRQSEKETVDEIATGIGALATEMQGMTERALYQLMPISEEIIAGRIYEEKDIDRHLSFMLDFCHDDTVLLLFKRVLRSIHNKHPELAYDYYRLYKDMWDSDEEDS